MSYLFDLDFMNSGSEHGSSVDTYKSGKTETLSLNESIGNLNIIGFEYVTGLISSSVFIFYIHAPWLMVFLRFSHSSNPMCALFCCLGLCSFSKHFLQSGPPSHIHALGRR